MRDLRRKESEIQKAIVNALAWTGWVVIHIPNQSTQGRQRWAGLLPGAPDLIAVRRGRVVFLEVKTDRGQLRPAQKAAHAILTGQGMEVRVVRGIEDIEDLLSDF